jgi:Dehydrogenases with different specificities (related to short-chain alcohol dehydrogenases)
MSLASFNKISKINNMVALVTGSSRGIGQAISKNYQKMAIRL